MYTLLYIQPLFLCVIFMKKMSINTPCMTTNSNTKAGADKVFSVNLIDFLSTFVGHTSFVRDCYQLENSVELAPMAARRLPRPGTTDTQ